MDATFIRRSYRLSEVEDYARNIFPMLHDIKGSETIEAEPQISRGKLIGWTIITTFK